MKVDVSLFGMTALFLGLINFTFAGEYYPPERISCNLNSFAKLSCEYLDRSYVTESPTTANLNLGNNEPFYFISAVAHLTSDGQSMIYFVYSNKDKTLINLQTISTAFHPKWTNKHWYKLQAGIYGCDASFRQCYITDQED